MRIFVVVLMIVFISVSAFAGGLGGMSKFSDLVKTAVDWLQGIGLAVAIGGVVLAGMRFISGEPDAKERVKSALIGSGIIAGASVIVGFIKGFF